LYFFLLISIAFLCQLQCFLLEEIFSLTLLFIVPLNYYLKLKPDYNLLIV